MVESLGNNHEVSMRELETYVRHILNMYIDAANNFLEEGDFLKDYIIDFYSKRTKTKNELVSFLKNKTEKDILKYLEDVKNFTSNKLEFIEQTEKYFEKQEVMRCRKEMGSKKSVATDEEYRLGVYAGFLESQVRDAVIVAQKKGYLTFQSGFKEGSMRDQFIDFYNRNIFISEKVKLYLKSKSIEFVIEKLDDRTTLTLHPTGAEPIRLKEWKEIWDTIIENFPIAEPETVSGMKIYQEHIDFRNQQNLIRNNLQ